MSIRKKLQLINSKIQAAAQKSGRNAQDVKLVAVVKNVLLESIIEAIEAGVTDIGENRVQEALGRDGLLRQKYPHLAIHMIGHLQRNKVRQALDMFAIIQSVDSKRLVDEISARAIKPVPILIEVNTSGETSKYGVEPDKTSDLVRYASAGKNIQVQGLMTVGPLSGEARAAFSKLREIRDEIRDMGVAGVEMRYLSMGMTDDFEVAIEEGSNIVRIGRGIFHG